jgi:hypothetical protein
MTAMSRFDRESFGDNARDPRAYGMASRLHRMGGYLFSLVLPAGLLVSTTACVIPLDLEVEVSDAGVSAPPILQSAASPFEFPGPFTLARENTDVTVSLTLSDNDVDDTLFIRLFLDYDATSGAGLVTDCTATPTGELERLATCLIGTVCNFIEAGDTTLHNLEAHVTDRLWLTADDPDAATQPPLRAIDVGGGAKESERSWTVRCE